MNILHLAYSCFPGQYRGGVSKIVYELGCSQAKSGHNVTIYSTNVNSGVRVDHTTEIVKDEGLHIRYFPVLWPRWYFSPKMYSALRTNIDQYDVLHAHNTWLAPNAFAWLIKQFRGVATFFNPHGALDPVVMRRTMGMYVRKRAYFELVEKRGYQLADGILVNTKHERQQLRDLGIRTETHIVPNGISLKDPDLYQERGRRFRRNHGITSAQPVVTFIGRLVPKKGIHILVDAFSMIAREFPDAVLVIAGDRSKGRGYIRRIDDRVRMKGLQGRVIWTGFVNEKAKVGVLGAATVFSHVTLSEGMPMAALEAMSAGIPTIVSPGSYLDDAIQNDAVLLAEYEPRSLARSLDAALRYRERSAAVGDRAIQHIKAHHDWMKIAQRTVRIYEDSTQ